MENDKLNIGIILGSARQQANLNGKVFEIKQTGYGRRRS